MSLPRDQREHCALAFRIFMENRIVIRKILWHVFRNKSDVDELVQDVFLKLLDTNANLQEIPVSCHKAYVTRAARHVAFDVLRHRRIVPLEYVAELPEDPWPAWITEDAASDVELEQELMQLVRVAHETLSERCLRVFTLRKVYGFTQKEIGAYLGITENTVEQHLAHAMRGVAAALEGSSGEPNWLLQTLRLRQKHAPAEVVPLTPPRGTRRY